MEIFYEILKKLEKLDLIIYINREVNKIDIRSVKLYSVLEDTEEVVVSQTRPPISRDMIGHEIEAIFVVKVGEKPPERFFFPAKIKNITLFPLRKFRLVDAIFLRPTEKKIYQKSLRLYPRIMCNKDIPLYVEVIPRDDKFKVIDISEGGLCFSCKKDMLNSIRFNPYKKLNMIISLSDNIKIETIAEVVRRFEREDFPDMYLIGVRFLDLSDIEKKKLVKLINKLKGAYNEK